MSGDSPIAATDKVARLLALLLVRDIEQKGDRVQMLQAAGFQISEIAVLLGLSENTVSVTAYQNRKKSGVRKRRKST